MVGRGVGGFIGSWLGIGVLVEFKSGNHGEVGLEVRGGFFFRDGRRAVKYFKVRLNGIIDYNVGWGVYRVVGAEVVVGDGEVF